MRGLLIPFALVNNKVKSINDIYKQDEPICLECGERLILRNGDKNIKHLAHTSNSNCVYRNEAEYKKRGGETYEHKYAKEYIRDNLKYFRKHKTEIIIKDGEFKLGGFKDCKVFKIQVEYRGLKKELNLDIEYIPDLLLRTNEGLIALEIYNKNKKDKASIVENLKDKDITVYEIDIREIGVLNFKEIFRNMKLLFSNLECKFNEAMKPIQNKIVECNELKEQLRNAKIIEFNNRIEQFDKAKEYIKNEYEQEIKWLKIKNENANKTSENRIKYLEKEIKRYEARERENIKCWSKCVKDWYSKSLNEKLNNDIKLFDKNCEEIKLMYKFRSFYNGKVGAYSNYGGDDKLKEIASMTNNYDKAREYIGINNDIFMEMVGMENNKKDKGEQILLSIVNEDVLEVN